MTADHACDAFFLLRGPGRVLYRYISSVVRLLPIGSKRSIIFSSLHALLEAINMASRKILFLVLFTIFCGCDRTDVRTRFLHVDEAAGVTAQQLYGESARYSSARTFLIFGSFLNIIDATPKKTHIVQHNSTPQATQATQDNQHKLSKITKHHETLLPTFLHALLVTIRSDGLI